MSVRKSLSELKESHRVFLEAYADTGNMTKSCELAGFGRANGYRVAERYEHLLAALVESKIAEAGLDGLRILRHIIANSKNDMVRFNAIKYIMNLAGYVAVEKKELSVSGLSDEQVESELKKLLGYEEEEKDVSEQSRQA